MKSLTAILVLSAAQLAAGDIPFDPKKPTLLKPEAVYAFSITPKEGLKPVIIRMHTEKDVKIKNDDDGSFYAPIGKLSVMQGGTEYDMQFEYTSFGVPNMDIEDFDGDGDLDFRIISDWGSGGSWYCYYRFNDGKYQRWEEPEDLGLNSGSAGEMAAFYRSGPENHRAHYQYKDGKFHLMRVEEQLLRTSLPELKSVKSEEFWFVDVVEEWDGDKLMRRIVTPRYEGKP